MKLDLESHESGFFLQKIEKIQYFTFLVIKVLDHLNKRKIFIAEK